MAGIWEREAMSLDFLALGRSFGMSVWQTQSLWERLTDDPRYHLALDPSRWLRDAFRQRAAALVQAKRSTEEPAQPEPGRGGHYAPGIGKRTQIEVEMQGRGSAFASDIESRTLGEAMSRRGASYATDIGASALTDDLSARAAPVVSELPFRAEVEELLGASLVDVRAYTNQDALLSPHGARAAAFRGGIAFAGTPTKEVVVHESVHTLQLRTAGVTRDATAAEAQAESAARAVSRGARRIAMSYVPTAAVSFDKGGDSSAGSAATFANGVRRLDRSKLKLLGASNPKLWNWVKASEPDATPTEVAALLLDEATWAAMSKGSGMGSKWAWAVTPKRSGQFEIRPAVALQVPAMAQYRPAGADRASKNDEATTHASHAVGAHSDKPKKNKATGFSKSGGGTVRDALTRLANVGKLKINANQIAQLDALAQVETGGQVASVDTTDDMIVSIGFHQVVLGHKSVEWVIDKAPAAFAKHGIELDMSKTYGVKGWSHPHQIKGVEDPEALRGHEWGDRFYAASLEDDVIVAIAEWALKEAKEVEGKTTRAGAAGSFWDDDTARTWMLEVDNNRPGYTSAAVQRAVALGANGAEARDAFLDILSKAIVETYEELEPKLVGYPALKRKFPHGDDAKLHELAIARYKPIGHTKGTHIVTRISRHLKVPTLNASVAAATPASASAVPSTVEHVARDVPTPSAGADHDAVAQSPVAVAPTLDAVEAKPSLPDSFTGPAHLRVTAIGLNVRSSPRSDDQSNVIRGLQRGDAIEAIGREGEWIAIAYNGGRAYVHGGFVEPVPVATANAPHVALASEQMPGSHGTSGSHDTSSSHGMPASDRTSGVDTAMVGPVGVWIPPTGTHLNDANLVELGAKLNDPKASQVLSDLAGVEAVSARMKPHLINGAEAAGTDRENLVAGIHAVRAGLQGIAGDAPQISAFKVAVNHKVQALSPYYSQLNINTIESKNGLSTCNMTSLAMSLSTIGKNADSYKENKRDAIVAVAKHFSRDVNNAKNTTSGKDPLWSSLRGLRLPDFCQFAAIANRLHSSVPSDDEIKAAANYAVKNKTDISFLAEIAADFGAHAQLSYHTIGNDTSALTKIGTAYHAEADRLVDARNAAEAHPKNHIAQQQYQSTKADRELYLNNADIEKQLPLEQYKASVMKVIQPLLDSGAGVVAGTYNHFTHCYAMTSDYVRVQDPGRWHRADRKVLWEEARALEYFWNYLVVR